MVSALRRSDLSPKKSHRLSVCLSIIYRASTPAQPRLETGCQAKKRNSNDTYSAARRHVAKQFSPVSDGRQFCVTDAAVK
jgi:hypothetical protein